MNESLCFINRLFLSEPFITICTALIIFILSQSFLEFFLKPRKNLLLKYGIFSSTLLNYHSKYRNGTLTSEQVDIIKKASNELMAQAWLVYKSNKKRKMYLEISKQINLITSQSMVENKDYNELSTAIKKIEQIDKNIKITFENL